MSANGHIPASTAAPARSAARHLRIRPAKLLVPAMLTLGVILILRYFEQSTAN